MPSVHRENVLAASFMVLIERKQICCSDFQLKQRCQLDKGESINPFGNDFLKTTNVRVCSMCAYVFLCVHVCVCVLRNSGLGFVN